MSKNSGFLHASLRFVAHSARLVTQGPATYWLWLGFLILLIVSGISGYLTQLDQGLIVTAMRDPVSWGMYIGNFTFLVGVAAAAVILVIPAYIYNWKPIKEIVIFGEILAVSAILMCILFVMVDIGRPDRFWHIMPLIGTLNFPESLLAWDILVLTAYFFLNFFVVTYLLYKAYNGEPFNKKIVWPLVILSIPLAVSIHTVTAFLFNGLAARSFWNASILAPRFLASAFCSGPAIMVVLFQVLRRTTNLEFKNEAIWKVAELMAYALAFNLFLLGAEVFKEFYSDTHHLLPFLYMFKGLGGHDPIVQYVWAAVLLQILAFVLLVVPRTRKNLVTLNIGCLALWGGVYIEKGMALVIPGFTPSTLGQIYEYTPTLTEIQVTAGVFSVGFLAFTLMLKVAVPITTGKFAVK